LAKHKFLAAPVVSNSDGSSEVDIICFLDIRDILLNFLTKIHEAFEPGMASSMLHRMRYLEEAGNPYGHIRIKDLEVKGGDGGFWFSKHAEKASIMELICKAFLSPSSCVAPGKADAVAGLDHIHRVALFGDDGSTLTSIITQTDIIRYLYENIGSLGALAHATISDLGWDKRPVLTVPPETAALDALKLMADKNISAIGVERDGCLIGNFSVSDMRAITADHFCSLALPVGEFLALEHGTEYAGYAAHQGAEGESSPHEAMAKFARSDSRRPERPGADVGQSLTLCEPTWTFAQVLESLVKNRIHRLYVVGSIETAAPILGLITMSDVLKLLAKSSH